MRNLTPCDVPSDLDARWGEWLEPEWIEALDSTPFLRSCREGTVTRSVLERFLSQQFFYSRHFTRYLCALLSNVVNDADRRELTENLVDETGLGKAGGVPHSVLYQDMLKELGVDINKATPLPETQNLVQTMWESCRNPNPAVGLGALCLGAEAIVPHVYSQIVQGFESCGIPSESLSFFNIHIACDDEHAVTMKNIIEREMRSPEQRMALRCSAARVISARTRFFGAIAQDPIYEMAGSVLHAHL